MISLAYYKTLNSFDDITKFRLINAFLFGIGLYLITPVLMDLRGELLTSTFITFILIATTLSVKTNTWMVNNMDMNALYQLGIIVHLFFTAGALLYFYDQLIFVYVDSFAAIMETAVFSAYRIKLDSYIAEHHADTVSKFQVFRNSTFADATLIGLGIVWFATYFGGNDIAVWLFVGFNSMFMMWMVYNWNYIKEHIKVSQYQKNLRKD